jgi:hypothetical protein
MGRQKLEAGKAREALDLFKLARRTEDTSKELRMLIFRAYTLRARQLEENKMFKEAETIRQLALEFRPVVENLSISDLLRYVKEVEFQAGIRAYSRFLVAHDPIPEVERYLADRLIATRQWEALADVRSDVPLRRDAEIMRQAVPLMDAGNWEAGLEALSAVPRQSPFAP